MNEIIEQAMTRALRDEGCVCARPVIVSDVPVPGVGDLQLPEPVIVHEHACPMGARWN